MIERVVGKTCESMTRAEILERRAGKAAVLMDVGAGRGAFVYEVARRRPDWLCVGVDADRRAMAALAAKSLRKPSRGGLGNVLFVAAAAESLPEDLDGLADRVCVNLPWGSLLRGVALGEPAILRGLRRVASEGAVVEFLLTYSEKYEPAVMRDLGLPPISVRQIREDLAPRYAEAGLRIDAARALSNECVRRLPLAWGKGLTRKRARDFFHIVARAPGSDKSSVLHALSLPTDVAPDMAQGVRLTAWGHPAVLATHPVSLEITREPDLTERGDCIVGVRADFDPVSLERLLAYRKLHVILRTANAEDRFDCGVNGEFRAGEEIVFRKSAHRSERTLGLHASKSAAQLSRRLVEDLQAGSRLEVTLLPARPLRR